MKSFKDGEIQTIFMLRKNKSYYVTVDAAMINKWRVWNDNDSL